MIARRQFGAADFSTTVYASSGADTPAAVAAGCDPFWTQMNGGYCSDTLGNYIRRDGSIVRVGGVEPSKRWFPSVSNEMVLAGVAILAVLLLAKAVER